MRITCIKAPEYGGFKPDSPTIRKTCRSVIFNTLVVGMSPVNWLIEHMFTILLFMRAEREEDWYRPLCAVENMLLYFFAPGHFATVVRPYNHQSRVSATFLNGTLPNMESCWDAISNSWSWWTHCNVGGINREQWCKHILTFGWTATHKQLLTL